MLKIIKINIAFELSATVYVSNYLEIDSMKKKRLGGKNLVHDYFLFYAFIIFTLLLVTNFRISLTYHHAKCIAQCHTIYTNALT